MALTPGTRVGPYEILCPIGSGGMGEVYRARDTKLGREVAVKALPEEFTGDTERISRFEREAKLLASLSHPGIATVHGLEESNGLKYLVMELVPGETLAERISRGPMRINECLAVFRQIAEALEAAHEKGIIHRDLKPANVIVNQDGRVKVLDFGLAKAVANEAQRSDLSKSPTLTREGTEHGVILGTAAYMSPEQVRGKTLDRRTDIWSFGCCFFEAMTGRKAFSGETVSDILAAILEREPDWSALPPKTPRFMRLLLRRCLEKDVAHRLRHIDPFQVEIEPEETVAVGRNRWALVPYLAGALVAGLAVWFLKSASTEAPKFVARFTLGLREGERLAVGRPGLAFSADGERLAYVAIHEGVQQIYVRALSELQAKPILGTEGGEQPFFSPDGEWLGFFADGKLKKISLHGGPAFTLTEASSPMGASWGPHDSIVFTPRDASGLSIISASGGELRTLTIPDSRNGEEAHLWPEFLPGAEALIFTIRRAGSIESLVNSSGGVALYLLERHERRTLIPDAGLAHYAPSGHLIYKRTGALFVAPFDIERLETTGPSFPLGEGVSDFVSAFSVSQAGWLVYEGGDVPGMRTLVWVDRSRAENSLAAPPSLYSLPRLSPDSALLAVAKLSQNVSDPYVWVYDLSRASGSRLTFDAPSFNPRWSSDGERIAFRNQPAATANIDSVGARWSLLEMSSKGNGAPRKLFESDYEVGAEAWTPDGRFLIFFQAHPETDGDVWVLPLEGERKPQPLIQTSADEGGVTISPDGRYVAYVSNVSGRPEVYVQPFPGPGGKRQLSTDGGTEPVWGRSGEIFYRHAKNMMAVSVTTEPTFTSTKPHVLFEDPYLRHGWFIPNYDVSPDGERFLMVKSVEEEEPAQLIVVQNWPELLKRPER
jgi:Tol biopolymer transport system component